MTRSDRVSDILGAHFAGGEREDPETVIRAHPELAELLRAAFRAREVLGHGFATADPIPMAGTRTIDDSCNVRGIDRAGTGDAAEAHLDRSDSGALDGFVPGGGRKPPFRFGDYDVTEEIARGGMGVVYRARHRKLDRWVALKMVRAGPLATSDELVRFRNEAEAAASLDHPGIVAVHDVGSVDEQPYFTMRLVEGGNLASRAQAHAGNFRWAVRLVEAVARAVEYGHQRGILHRDLKPGNVLLEADDRPVIADFGLARRADARGSGLTQTGAVLGTPEYMAPEQARGDTRSITTAADVWALGVILYELLAGDVPFAGDHPIEVLRKVITQDPVPPSRLVPQIPGDLDSICLRCLRKTPRDRYPSAGALADDLGRFLRGMPVAARPLGLAARALRWGLRHPARMAVAALVLLAIGGWITLTLGQARDLAAAERRLRAPLYQTLGAQAAQEAPPLRAGLLFARGVQLHSTRVGRIGMLAHRRPVPLRVVPLASGEIWRIAFDGKGELAAVGTDQGVYLWDVMGDHVRPLGVGPSRGPVRGIAFHPDGRRLATGADDGVVALWDLASGLQLSKSPQRPPPGAITSLAVAGQGRFVVYAGPDDRLWIWDLMAGNSDSVAFEPVSAVAPDDAKPRVTYVASDVSGDRVLVGAVLDRRGGLRRGEARLWDLRSRKFIPGAVALEGVPWCVEFSPDGRQFAIAEGEGVGVWRTDDLSRVSRLPPDRDVGAVAFDRDSRTVVYGTVEGYVRRWDPDTGFTIGSPIVQPQAVRAVAVTSAGRHLATGGQDGVLRLWDMPTGAPESRIVRGLPGLTMAAVETGDRWLLAATDKPALHLVDLASGRTVSRQPILGPVVGKLTATGTEGGWRCVARATAAGVAHWLEVRVASAARLEVIDLGPLVGFPASATVAFDPGGGSVYATGREENVLRRWSRKDATIRDEVVREGVRVAAITKGGDALVILDDRGTIRVLGSSPPYAQRAEMRLGSNFMSLAVTSDASRVALWTSGSPISRIVDPTTGREVGSLPPGANMQAEFSPDGSALITGVAETGKLQFLDGVTGQPLARVLLHPGGRTQPLATFSPSGAFVAVPTLEGEVHVWDVGWLRDDPSLDAAQEWERAQLAAMRTIDDDAEDHAIPLLVWRERRNRWVEPVPR